MDHWSIPIDACSTECSSDRLTVGGDDSIEGSGNRDPVCGKTGQRPEVCYFVFIRIHRSSSFCKVVGTGRRILVVDGIAFATDHSCETTVARSVFFGGTVLV